jgi:serine-type D-Ala-D-Ala carboxypeptidase/endopeptidase
MSFWRSRVTRRSVVPAFRLVLPLACLAAVSLIGAGCRPASRPPAVPVARTAPSADALRAILAQRLEHNGTGIVAGVIDREGRRVVGYGKLSASDPRVPDGETMFQLGSLTKVFTTLLLADMVERGEVRLDDPAGQYLPPGVRMPLRGRPITLRDLATHMSGLPSMPTNYDLAAAPDPYEAYTDARLYDFLSTYVPERAPGENGEYSNLGVALLGRLLAARAGMSYEALLTARVLRPLGMNCTSITLGEDQARRLAPGHDRYLQPVRTWEMANLQGSGSLRSTANDMLLLLAAYLRYRDTPLDRAMRLQLGERIPIDRGWQALGWVVRTDGVVRHAGGKQGYRSGLVFDPASGIGAVVLANARTEDQPIDLAMHLVSGTPLPPAPAAPSPLATREIPFALLDRYVGRYRLENGEVLEVARADHRILVHTPGNGVSEFLATGETDFFLNTGNDELTFTLGADGQTTGLLLYGDGRQGQATPAVRLQDR